MAASACYSQDSAPSRTATVMVAVTHAPSVECQRSTARRFQNDAEPTAWAPPQPASELSGRGVPERFPARFRQATNDAAWLHVADSQARVAPSPLQSSVRILALQADSLSTTAVDLPDVWRHLLEGHLTIRDTFLSHDRCYLVLTRGNEPLRKPILDRDGDWLQRRRSPVNC